jgi:Protein of unknown function (DUF4239)
MIFPLLPHLDTLPVWASALMLIGGMTMLAAIGPVVTRRFVRYERLSSNNEVAGFKFATLGVVYAVLLAFAVVVVWERFHDAEAAVAQEAGAVASLYRLSDGLDPATRDALQAALGRYLRTVIEEDWPAIAGAGEARAGAQALTAVYAAALGQEPTTQRAAASLAGILGQLDGVTQARRQRLDLASGTVPGVVWMVLTSGACLTLAFTCFFGTSNLRAQVLMTAMMAMIIAMSLYVVMALNRPFAGPVQVSAEQLVLVLEDFDPAAKAGGAAIPGRPR